MKHRLNILKYHIHFHKEDKLHIVLETPRLEIRSILAEDKNDYIAMTSDPIVMQKFASGKPWDEKAVEARMKTWLNRWEDYDPYSTYTIFDKKTKKFIGMFGLGHSQPGESEIIYILNHDSWGKGYGRETINAIFHLLVPRLMLRNTALENAPLKKVVATARLDNMASQQMLRGVGFKAEEQTFKFEAWRHSFGLFAKKSRNEYQQFFTSLDRKNHHKEQAKMKNLDVDISDIEMAMSSFGQKR